MDTIPEPPATSTDNPHLAWALYSAEVLHIPVFPCHGVDVVDGVAVCHCKRGAECTEKGKHPKTGTGVSAATLDRAQIIAWWTADPAANIGGRMGSIASGGAGLVAIDLDGLFAGNGATPKVVTAMMAAEQECGPLPDTAWARTGRKDGGRHLFFRLPEGRHRHVAQRLAARRRHQGRGQLRHPRPLAP
jgi:hypothetical protein